MNKVKTSWNEVTLGEFIELGLIEADEALEGLALTKRVKQMAVVSDITEEQLLSMSAEDFNEVFNKMSFLDTSEEGTLEEFIIDGVTYKAVDPTKMSAGEVISIETILRDGVANNVNTVPQQLAIMIRPVDEVKFDPTQIDKRAKLFEEKLTVPNFIMLLVPSMTS